MNIRKYLKSIIIMIVALIVLNLITSIIVYFNIIKNINYIKLLIVFISITVSSIYLGYKSNEKGWLEGLKFGILTIIILLVSSLIFTKSSLSIKSIIYYLIILIISALGSMIGISKKK